MYIVKVLKAGFITHNVKHFVVEKPQGYAFVPGQATDVSINTPELREELRPFTFTSVNAADTLEFIIKIYTGHDGITEQLGKIDVGDELILHDVFGAITYKGKGVFIAAGAGITPFISIFRQLKSEGDLAGNTLLFANRSAADIILGEELKDMLGTAYTDILENAADPAIPGQRIDKNLLQEYIDPDRAFYYICGPDKFISVMSDYLQELGINESKIVIEQ